MLLLSLMIYWLGFRWPKYDAFTTYRRTSMFSLEVTGSALCISGKIWLAVLTFWSFRFSYFCIRLITASVLYSYQRISDFSSASLTPLMRFFSMLISLQSSVCLCIFVLLSSSCYFS